MLGSYILLWFISVNDKKVLPFIDVVILQLFFVVIANYSKTDN